MLSSETEKVCEAQIQLYLWGLFVLQGRAYIAFSIISSIQAVKKQQRNNKETTKKQQTLFNVEIPNTPNYLAFTLKKMEPTTVPQIKLHHPLPLF